VPHELQCLRIPAHHPVLEDTLVVESVACMDLQTLQTLEGASLSVSCGYTDAVAGPPRLLGAPRESHMSTSPVPRTPEMLVGVGARLSTHPATLSPSNDASQNGESVRPHVLAAPAAARLPLTIDCLISLTQWTLGSPRIVREDST
jgi:hypothetical protein